MTSRACSEFESGRSSDGGVDSTATILARSWRTPRGRDGRPLSLGCHRRPSRGAETREHGAEATEQAKQPLDIGLAREPEDESRLRGARGFVGFRARNAEAVCAVRARPRRRLRELQVGAEQRTTKLVSKHAVTARPCRDELVTETQRFERDVERIRE